MCAVEVLQLPHSVCWCLPVRHCTVSLWNPGCLLSGVSMKLSTGLSTDLSTGGHEHPIGAQLIFGCPDFVGFRSRISFCLVPKLRGNAAISIEAGAKPLYERRDTLNIRKHAKYRRMPFRVFRGFAITSIGHQREWACTQDLVGAEG